MLGLRPAIWIGGFCCKKTPIYKDHPEWFIDYDYRVKNSAPLDPSKAEAREYMTHALDKLITEYGFDGVKQDFWSYAFEDSNDLYRGERDRSGYEMRDWWLKEFRKRLPQDAHFQTGCDIVMGNPFLGEFYTNYRYGIDIGNGKWENVKISFLWGAACFATHTGDLFVPNSDSVGVFPGLSDDEALFCINYCLVTGSMVEISGYLDTYDGNPRMAYLRKAVCCPNNGQEIFLAGLDYRTGDKAPEKFFFKGPFFSLLRGEKNLPLRTLGLFNLEDEDRSLSVTLDELDLPAGKYLAWDVWKGTVTPFDGRFASPIPAHGSALYSIVPLDGGIQLLDSDLKVSEVEMTPDGLRVAFAFAGKAALNYWDGKALRHLDFDSAAPGDAVVLR